MISGTQYPDTAQIISDVLGPEALLGMRDMKLRISNHHECTFDFMCEMTAELARELQRSTSLQHISITLVNSYGP